MSLIQQCGTARSHIQETVFLKHIWSTFLYNDTFSILSVQVFYDLYKYEILYKKEVCLDLIHPV